MGSSLEAPVEQGTAPVADHLGAAHHGSMVLLHLLSHPNPTIGYGVLALHLQQELAALAGSGTFLFQSTDLGRPGELTQVRELLETLPIDLPVVNVLVGDGRTSHEVLDRLPGLKVTYTVFETDILPLGWKENLQRSDLVLTASTWGADILRQELGATPIAVVPGGVDPLLHHQWNRPTELRPWQRHERADAPLDDCFRFLCVGKFETRKSYAELLAAFALAFADRPDVRLQLRPHNIFDPSYREQLERLVPPELRQRVLIVEGDAAAAPLSAEAMAELYRSSHCFVFPSKGEGWGLPLIEAISCGTPFITTHTSGQLEYLNHCQQSFSRIEHHMVEIGAADYLRFHRFPPGQPARWAQPDVGSLASCMRQVYETWPALRQQAALNARTIHQRFSWTVAAETLVDRIQELLQAEPPQAVPLAGPGGSQAPLGDATLLALLGKRRASFSLCADHLRAQEAPLVLELGTTRSFRTGVIDTTHVQSDPRHWDWGGGCSTYVIPALAPSCRLESVDPDPAALAVAQRLCRPFHDRIRFLATSSTLHLSSCGQAYDLIYMDHGETGPETSALHRHDAQLIVERSLLRPGGLILIDDQGYEDASIGKGSLSIPYLLAQGFTLLTPPDSYQAVLRAPGDPSAAARPTLGGS